VTDQAALKARVDRGTAWVAVASLILGSLDLISNLLCIRLFVSAADFGAATLAIALFPILDRIGTLGAGPAMIQQADGTTETESSIFWLALAGSIALLAVLLAVRPVVAGFFPTPIVATLLCAYAARIVYVSFYIVPESLLKRELRYGELSIIRMVAMGADTATKLFVAYLGAHGRPELKIWCFVAGPIVRTLVTGIGVQLCHPWRPRFQFRRRAAAAAARFGMAVSGGELLYFLYTSADYVVVGRRFGDAAVGIYRLAYELVIDVVRLVSLVTAEVAFPAFARLAATPGAVAGQLIRFTRQNLIALAPFLVFLLIEADDLLALLYPPLGPAAATAARILCAVGALRTLSFVVPPMLAGIGRASRALVYNAIAAVVLPIAFVVATYLAPAQGYLAVAWAWAAGYPIAFLALLVMALPLAGLAVGAYVRAIAGVALCAAGGVVAGIAVRLVLPEIAAVRVPVVAVVVLVAYAGLLAKIEGVTPAGIVRAFRSSGGQAS
jgi:O-antigen/teichoic acid export membrane protein